MRGPNVQTTVEQKATLRIPLANVRMPQPLNPAHLVIQPQSQIHPQSGTQPPMYLTSAQPTTPSAAQVAPYGSAPAAHAPHMVLSATPRLESEAGTSSSMSSARVQSVQSSAPPSMRSGVTAPDMSHMTPSEQAVIQALQAVANYPESRDFVETNARIAESFRKKGTTRGLSDHERRSRFKHRPRDQKSSALVNTWIVARI